MKVVLCIIVVVAAVFQIRAEEKECFDWAAELTQLKNLCQECKQNYTKQEDIEECFDGSENDADDNGNFNEDAYIADVLEYFKGDAELKATITNQLKECLKAEAKTSAEVKEVAKCVDGVFIKNCKEAEARFKEVEECPELKGCL